MNKVKLSRIETCHCYLRGFPPIVFEVWLCKLHVYELTILTEEQKKLRKIKSRYSYD